MPKTDTVPLAEQAPAAANLTDYDRAHAATYLRLLDAAESNAEWTEVARIVLNVDSTKEPERARQRYDSHMARARWIASHGYRDFLRG